VLYFSRISLFVEIPPRNPASLRVCSTRRCASGSRFTSAMIAFLERTLLVEFVALRVLGVAGFLALAEDFLTLVFLIAAFCTVTFLTTFFFVVEELFFIPVSIADEFIYMLILFP
jgi:hypothetical protein